MNTLFSVRHNAMTINSIKDFCRIKSSLCGSSKSVYFLRVVGYYDGLLKDISEMDNILSDGSAGLNYYRFSSLPKLASPDDIGFYSERYAEFTGGRTISLKKSEGNAFFSDVLRDCLEKVLTAFSEIKSSVSETIKKNFCIKLLFWLDYALEKAGIDWSDRATVKISAADVSSVQDYLFYYLLTLIGFDVLLIQCGCDIDSSADKPCFSRAVVMGEKKSVQIPQYIKPERRAVSPVSSVSPSGSESGSVTVKIPERNRVRQSAPMINTAQSREKTLEELARLASSVVMIGIHDSTGKAIGSGSGIMIGRNGFILTNNHVANGGRFYSVKIEDDDNIYKTDEVIKYNSLQDLAIIRIDRTLSPIPIYNGKNGLARGQKVVAIGSPLGLFNTVSDGIISGFRKIKSVDMIQFTAPISHGSSGGALLNMNGELIGISTAGIDEGQNINLAMGYECINLFVKGFI